MAALEIVVTGDADVARALKAAAAALGGPGIERALVAGALLIQNAAKQNAPVLSGTLRRSIHVGGHTFGGGGGDIGGNSATQVAVGTNLAYARRIEYGFSGADALGRVYNQAAQPYLRPAMDSERGAAIREVGAALQDLLRAALS